FKTRRFYLGDGDESIVRFIGRMEADVVIEELVELNDDGSPDLDGMDESDLNELCAMICAFGIREDSTDEDLCAAIDRRIRNELEPIIQVKHYIKRNDGRPGLSPWGQCADTTAAVTACDWTFETECRTCSARMQGDKGISTQIKYTWSVYDTQKTHQVAAKGKTQFKKGQQEDKAQYEPCTLDSKGRCQHCAQNKRIDPRSQKAIPLEELKKLTERGYSR